MKKMLLTLVMGLLTVSFAAYANNPSSITKNESEAATVQQSKNNPGAVALKFFNNLKKGTFDKNCIYSEELYTAYKNATAAEKKIYDGIIEMAFEELGNQFLEEFSEIKDAKFSVVKETISKDGKRAKVTMNLTYQGESEAQEIPMIKVDGKWLIDIDNWE